MSTVFQALAGSRRPRTRERKDMQPRRVRVADIERLKRTLENVPEHQAEEVTTAQAVRMLSSQIHAMQAKGYGLPAIAELLSDNGLAVTATTLKTYLSETRAAGGRKNRRKSKAHRPVGTGARGIAKVAPAATTPPAPTAPAVTPKGTARPNDDASARRSAFVPKEDTRDI